MKYMAKNSVFAILLRKGWWMSLLVAAALIFFGLAIFPPAYAFFPIAAAIPFVIIAGISAWKHRHKPSAARVDKTMQALMAMSWSAFATQLEIGLRNDGCQVKPLKSDAADFEIARPGAGKALMSARRWKAAHTGIEPLQRLQQARTATGAGQAIYVTLGVLSEAARDFANKNDIRFMDAESLTQLLRHQQL